MSSSLDRLDMKSSSVSIPALEAVVVTGVGGAVSGPTEARILLLEAVGAEDIVASAAFRLRVVGGMVPVYGGLFVWSVCPSTTREDGGGLQSTSCSLTRVQRTGAV